MNPNDNKPAADQDIETAFDERLHKLPKVVQDAIQSADISKRLRELAEQHKLHLDQWELLENEVRLALLGFQPLEDLGQNLARELGIPQETSVALAEDISNIVFEPIREELERQLDHPDAKAADVSAVEAAGAQALKDSASPSLPAAEPASTSTAPAPQPVVPATPPPAPPEEKAVRAPISESYRAGQVSSERKAVHDDPYREPPQ